MSEAVNLNVKDVDLKNGVLRLRNTKYNSERLPVLTEKQAS